MNAAMATPLSFLRPLGLPRPSTLRHFFRFSTRSPTHAATQQSTRSSPPSPRPTESAFPHSEGTFPCPSSSFFKVPLIKTNTTSTDPNLIASQTASPTYPPPSMKSLPRPINSRASHRTNHPRPPRTYPTRHPTNTPPPSPPSPLTLLPTQESAPNLPYFVTRSSKNSLPIYTLRKRGGNLKMTRVKRVDGRAEVLGEELRGVLGLSAKGEVVVSPVNGHVMLKGHHKEAVERFLRERRF